MTIRDKLESIEAAAELEFPYETIAAIATSALKELDGAPRTFGKVEGRIIEDRLEGQ